MAQQQERKNKKSKKNKKNRKGGSGGRGVGGERLESGAEEGGGGKIGKNNSKGRCWWRSGRKSKISKVKVQYLMYLII